MNYWWVTQNKTFEEEIRGGYMWAPKAQKNGHSLLAYTNVSLVKPNDIIFSYAQSNIIAVGHALSAGYTSMKPHGGETGDLWQSEGWRVDVDYTMVPDPYKPISDFNEIRPLLPATHSPLVKSNGRGAQGMYLASISPELANLLLNKIGINPTEVAATHIETYEQELIDDEKAIWDNPHIPDTTKERLVLSRVGQDLFRKRVKMFEQKCRVTGVQDDNYLIASHIKPWAKADDHERLDGNNGLLLSPHIDRLFDRGFMTFAKNGEVFLSKDLSDDVVSRWSLQGIENVGAFTAAQEHFLEHHRELVFRD